MTLHTRTIVVTGAASGMGRATAELFRDSGWRVLGIDVAAAGAPVEPQEADAPSGGSLVPLVADVRSRESVEGALASALQAGDRIHAVANIAGIYPPSSLSSYDVDSYRRIFDVNVLGVVNVIAAARPYMEQGTIINFASVDAFEVSPGQLFYGASKAAVVMLTKSLALELAPAGIRVNGIAPGWVETPGNAATGRMAAAAASIPLGRVAQPEEIARWVHLLTDELNTVFLTGETITLSGGAVIRQ